MLLTDKQISKFQAIYKARFGKEISREKAYDMGIKLVRMMQIVYKPMIQADFNRGKKLLGRFKCCFWEFQDV